MSTQPAELVRRFWDDVWTQGRTQELSEIFGGSPTENGEPLEIDGFRQGIDRWREIFPDFKVVIEELIPVGLDRIVSRVTYRGTHVNQWAGLPPTGSEFEVLGIDIFTVQGGRITQFWHTTGHLDMAIQLGGRLVPRTAASPVDQKIG